LKEKKPKGETESKKNITSDYEVNKNESSNIKETKGDGLQDKEGKYENDNPETNHQH